jgi:prepilin-type processing-associated H-X9-DG protein
VSSGPVHSGGANYLACDGHVKWLQSNVLSGGISNPSSLVAETLNNGGGMGYAAGTGCLDNVPADFGNAGCPHPNAATLTFSAN